ncbi:MAG: hypothetical protein IT370_22770 [Deltaproteobacteria bacterium]|nr:hypothetical protein [Deltaproteobacteria bacterium]
MQTFRDRGFVLEDDLQLEANGDGRILISGRVICEGGLYIGVSKVLSILSGDGPTSEVQTDAYSYNAVLGGIGNVFRYDSPHLRQEDQSGHERPDHHQIHHKHTYDVLRGGEQTAISEVSEIDWPTLGEVIEELADWYYANFDAVDATRGRAR